MKNYKSGQLVVVNNKLQVIKPSTNVRNKDMYFVGGKWFYECEIKPAGLIDYIKCMFWS